MGQYVLSSNGQRSGAPSRRVIMQNLTMSVLILAALVVGTLVGEFGMITAVLGHEGSEVLIILNGLRVDWK